MLRAGISRARVQPCFRVFRQLKILLGPENATTMCSVNEDGPDDRHPLFWDKYLKIATANSW
jgi:hypothetical protein